MKIIGIIVSLLLIAIIAFATVKKVSPVGWGWWGTSNTTSGVALHGYDPVAYFVQGSPQQGNDAHSAEWGDATWHFASESNQQMFESIPEKYAPQFGGFCSFAVSKGFTADANPDAWHIDDGKLYVFMDTKVRDDWVAQIAEGSLQQSRQNWAKRQ